MAPSSYPPDPRSSAPATAPGAAPARPQPGARPAGLSMVGDNAPTQWLRSADDYLDAQPDIGRVVGPHTREFFVSCEPGEALVQQLQHLQPLYVAIHDMACTASRHLLQAVAVAAGQPVRRLVIRRQGYGTTLAVLHYLECPTEDGEPLRLYATDADDADTAVRASLARVLLCRAQLGVVLVGDTPAHALPELLQPLRLAIFSGGWQCRHLDFLPLTPGSSAALGNLTSALGAGAGLDTRVAPLSARPSDAWSWLAASWNRLQPPPVPGTRSQRLPGAAPSPDPLQPMPQPMPRPTPAGVPASSAAPTAPAPLDDTGPDTRPGGGANPLQAAAAATREPFYRMTEQLATQPGVSAVCVFVLDSAKVIAHAGLRHDAQMLAKRGSLLVAAAHAGRRHLGMNPRADELIVTGDGESQAVRLLASHPGMALHLVFQPSRADWSQLRPRVMALDAALPRVPVI